MSILSDFSHLLLGTDSATVSTQRSRSTLLCCPYPQTCIAAVSWLPIMIKVWVSFEQSILLCSLVYSGRNPKRMDRKGHPPCWARAAAPHKQHLITLCLSHSCLILLPLVPILFWSRHASVQTQVKYNHGIYTLCKYLTSPNTRWCQCTLYLKKAKWFGIPALD